MRAMRRTLVLGMVAGTALAASAGFASGQTNATVVVSNVATSDTSLVPGGDGLRFSNFRRPYASPDGTKWIMISGTGTSTASNMVLMSSGGVLSAPILPGSPTPWDTGFNFGNTFTRNCGINNAGQWAVGGADSSGSANDAIVVKKTGANIEVHAREGSAAFGVLGTNGVNFGGTFDSVGIGQAGDISFYSTLANTSLGTSDDTALWHGANSIVQEGTTVLANQAQGDSVTVGAMRTNRYLRSSDGLTYIEGAQLNTATTRDQIIFVNGTIVLQENETVLDGYVDPVGNTSAGLGETNMAPNGDWFVRGNNGNNPNQSAYWVMRNEVLIAKEGDFLFPCSEERWTRRQATPAIFYTNIGNANGDYIVGGATDVVDENLSGVLVLNGNSVVMRSNDPVDLNGNGLLDDDTYIRNFFFDDAVLTPDRKLYVVANLKDGAGTLTGKALLVKQVATKCAADFNGSGSVTADDIFAFLDAWFAQNGQSNTCLSADVNSSGGVTADDIFAFLDSWFALNGGVCP